MLGSHGNPSRCGFRQPLPCLLLAIFFCLCPALLPGLFLPPSLLPVPAARACIPLPWCFPLLVSWYPLAPGAPVVSFIAACMITAPGRPPGGICRAYLQLLVYSPPGAHLLSCFASGVGRTVLFIAAYYLPVLLLASGDCCLARACYLPACYPQLRLPGSVQAPVSCCAAPRRALHACLRRLLRLRLHCPSASSAVPWGQLLCCVPASCLFPCPGAHIHCPLASSTVPWCRAFMIACLAGSSSGSGVFAFVCLSTACFWEKL